MISRRGLIKGLLASTAVAAVTPIAAVKIFEIETAYEGIATATATTNNVWAGVDYGALEMRVLALYALLDHPNSVAPSERALDPFEFSNRFTLHLDSSRA